MIVDLRADPLIATSGSATGVRITATLFTGAQVIREVWWRHEVFVDRTPEEVSRYMAVEMVRGINSLTGDIYSELPTQ